MKNAIKSIYKAMLVEDVFGKKFNTHNLYRILITDIIEEIGVEIMVKK